MAIRIDHERVKILLQKCGLNDREIAERLGTNQSTIWRLRNGQIAKVGKYLLLLEQLLPSADKQEDLEELRALAARSPALREVLRSLMRFMREDAEPDQRS